MVLIPGGPISKTLKFKVIVLQLSKQVCVHYNLQVHGLSNLPVWVITWLPAGYMHL